MGMRKAVAIAVTSAALFSPAALAPHAIAETNPTPLPTSAPLSPFEQYRIDRENYFAAMKELTGIFKSACDRANATYASAITVAKTKDQKRAARLARENAITAAAIEFENAKYDLGPMPIEPPRSAKAPAKNKSKSR
jgi:hypothetical protein